MPDLSIRRIKHDKVHKYLFSYIATYGSYRYEEDKEEQYFCTNL